MLVRFHRSLWRNRQLWWRLTEREVLGRYRGSLLGVGWTFLQPLLMLGVYTFVFSQVFKARWSGQEELGPIAFAINIFTGLIVFNLVAECVSRAPSLVISNPSYVTKVVFPLDLLVPVTLGNALVHASASLIILGLFELLAFRMIPASVLWLPIVWIPLILGCLGVSWVLASLGVFLRDIGQLVGVLLSMLMYLSPIFFPITALPVMWRPFLNLNPLASIIGQTRIVLVEGGSPSVLYLSLGTALGLVVCEAGHRLFERSKRAFPDVM